MLPCILPLLDVASGPQTFWRYAEFVRLVASALAWALSPIRHVHSSLSQLKCTRWEGQITTKHWIPSLYGWSWKVVAKTKKVFFGESQPSKTACLKNSIRSRCSAGTWSATLGASSQQQLPSLPRGYLQQPSRPCWHHAILVLLQNLHVVLCNMNYGWVWMIMYDYMVGILYMWHFDHRSQPAGATSWKTCLACPKGTYQPIEAATRTTSLEGCC